jgi:hypothetical protein
VLVDVYKVGVITIGMSASDLGVIQTINPIGVLWLVFALAAVLGLVLW